MRWLRPGAHRRGAEAALDPVRILTPELSLQGFVAPTGQRITDILLRGEDLPFLPAGADADPQNWVLIAPHDLLVVIPPPLPPRRQWLEPIKLRGAFAETGPYRITGLAHLRSKETLDERHRAQQPFLPLTQATIAHADGTSEVVPVAIVNLDNCGAFGLED
jgi:hypothetical protein